MNKKFSSLVLALLVLSPASAYSQDADARYSAFRRANGGRYARSWNPAWTNALLGEIRRNWARLNSASDIENYCPGYSSKSRPEQENCFVRLATGIMSYESGFSERILGDGGRAAGLMQIWSMNCRRERMGTRELLVAQNNFRCGVRMMGDLISRDRVIAQERQVIGRYGTPRMRRFGLGRGGWSVMMRNQWVGRWQVGHLDSIQAGVRTYLDHSQGSMANRVQLRDLFATYSLRRRDELV